MNQTYIIIIVCILLAIFAVWREIIRANKRNLWLRLAAVLFAIGALACIILPVSYSSITDSVNGKQAVLLTDGFNADSISRNDTVVTLSKSIAKTYPKAKLINGLQDITNAKPAYVSVKILGFGLGEDELKQLDSLPVDFNSPKPPQGIPSVNWNTRLKAGETLTVQGRYNNPSNNVINLVLKGLGTTLDSATIPTGGATTFDLKAKPKNIGRAVYRLLAISGKDTISNDGIPLEVLDTRPLNVLILANTPDFENKFLKDWLTVNHYGVALRSMISKDKYSQEFANVPQQSLGTLTSALLSKFDAVFATLDVLKTLKPAEAGALKQQVLQKGTGVIVRADSTTHSGHWLQQNFSLGRSANTGQVATAFKIQGGNNLTSKLLVDPYFIAAKNDIQPLLTDPQGRLIAGVTLQGAGREIFTVLNNTHNWMLSGNEKDYTAYWSLLISKAAKVVPVNSQWVVKTAVPYVNGHVKVQLSTSVANPQLKINAEKVSVIQQPDMPFQYIADYWPAHAGWQQVQQGSDAPQWFYIYPQTEWQSLKRLNLSDDTWQYAMQHRPKSVTKQIQHKVAIAVSKTYFYVLLLLAFSYLWAEAKFSR
ncbi:hypothetical protein [Mucilaginibacter ginkgonis]|uniref:Uncharacterized protein n=1 Tax=Mucilaginibacter ginkgonis TaxID=2682091 RepID=A0A6I4HW44_9SPHI|nr:hypothetical protein [Mucilaginibacter ginkgonis]QQL49814.1 hypothetical protein GO620_016865 [Mucilaginibacter ginkgonis]